jgi:hypothetical protein
MSTCLHPRLASPILLCHCLEAAYYLTILFRGPILLDREWSETADDPDGLSCKVLGGGLDCLTKYKWLPDGEDAKSHHLRGVVNVQG